MDSIPQREHHHPPTETASDLQDLAHLYRSAVVLGPKESQVADKEVAPALRRLAEAKREGKLPLGIVDAWSLVCEGSWGAKTFEFNRIANLGTTGSPYYNAAREEAIRLAGLFPEQFPDEEKSQRAAYQLRLVVEEGPWVPASLRDAALDTLAAIGNATVYDELERAVWWADNVEPDKDHGHWRRRLLTTLLAMSFSKAKQYIWGQLRKLSDDEATAAWQSILAHPEASTYLAESIPENLVEASKLECALTVARQVGPATAPFQDALERKLEQVRLK